MRSPFAAEIIDLRMNAGLTRPQAWRLIHASKRSWEAWERGERNMHPGLWELFQIKVRHITLFTDDA